MAVTELNLFAGTGAMSVGLRAAIPGARTVGYVEWDAYAATTILARMEEQALDRAPVFVGDVYDFDARPYRGAVHIVTASPPCQPYSVAGRRRGNDDDRSHGEGRGPIVGMLNVIEAVEPAFVFFENVPPWVTAGHFRSVRRRLRDLGYECEEPLFLRASDVGAPHRRERVFILAYRDGEREAGLSAGSGTEGEGEANVERSQQDVADADLPQRTRQPVETYVERPESRPGSGDRGTVLADAPRDNQRGSGKREQGRQGKARGRRNGVANPKQPRSQGFGSEQPQRRGEPVALRGDGPAHSLFPPGPGDTDAWARTLADNPTLEPAICRVADGMAYRMDRLRCTGNGVVPLQVAVAFAILFAGVE